MPPPTVKKGKDKMSRECLLQSKEGMKWKERARLRDTVGHLVLDPI